jgi:hypothetical protein
MTTDPTISTGPIGNPAVPASGLLVSPNRRSVELLRCLPGVLGDQPIELVVGVLHLFR